MVQRSVSRVAISVGVIAVLLAVCLRLRHVNQTTVALLIVLVIVGLAKMWGWTAALTGAITGGIGFDYYILPPRNGFGIDAPEHWIALVVFMVTAVATGQTAARLEQRRLEAEAGRSEMEKLHELVNALLESGSAESTAARIAEKLVDIFGLQNAVFYDKQTGQIYRAGTGATAISDQSLREAAISGRQISDTLLAVSVIPIRYAGELMGSLGLSGALLSDALIAAIAGRVALGLARLYAIEKSAEAEIGRRSEELKSAVLDAMAHEIRNPLNSVKLAVTTLLSGRVSGEAQNQEMLTIIDEEANRMDRAIDEAVELARLEASELSLKKEPQDLAQLIPVAIEEMGARTSRRAIHLQLPESLPAAECDRCMLLRVVKELLNNAIKYSPEGSPLAISAGCTGMAIVIDVVDQGPGVAEENRERIFEKYYRGGAACDGITGTGLGLASAKYIIQAHGGEIWVTTPPGGGAAFHFSLPVVGARQTVGAS